MRDCEDQVCFDTTSTPEFDHWRWVDYWHPLQDVIYFKREVYTRVLEEFAPVVFPDGAPPKPNHKPQRRASYLRRRRN
ncbi:MAG TPA: RNA pyrophosphohydrolase, partial [Gammaproteobacteria bacterium]|nr:RNA pyrophosphohydrolase [Gammaproteobacteria bacterium]